MLLLIILILFLLFLLLLISNCCNVIPSPTCATYFHFAEAQHTFKKVVKENVLEFVLELRHYSNTNRLDRNVLHGMTLTDRGFLLWVQCY